MSGLIVALTLAVVGASDATASDATAPDAKAPKHEPGSPEAVELAIRLITEADAAAKEGRVARAIRLAEQVAVLAPAAPGAQRMLGELYLTVGDCAIAIKHLREFERIGRDSDAVKRAGKQADSCLEDGKRRGKLVVSVLPAGATVRVIAPWQEGPVAAGQGDVKAKLPIGSYRVHASLPGHAPLQARVRVLPKSVVRVAEALEVRPAELVVRSSPAGASVSVDGDPSGVAPITISPVAPGDHEVVATLAGHGAATTTVRVAPGQQVALTLRPTPLPAAITVVTEPAGARIAVGGVDRCSSPCEVPVPPGAQSLVTARLPGWVTGQRELTGEAGQTGEVRLTLVEAPAALAEKGRRRWAVGLAATGAVLAAAGAWALGQGFSSADAADDAYSRYQGASDGASANRAWGEMNALDKRADTERLVGVGLLSVAAGAGLWAASQWVFGADAEGP